MKTKRSDTIQVLRATLDTFLAAEMVGVIPGHQGFLRITGDGLLELQ
jgi:hypothetical protein